VARVVNSALSSPRSSWPALKKKLATSSPLSLNRLATVRAIKEKEEEEEDDYLTNIRPIRKRWTSLVNKDIMRLPTRLRHADLHNHRRRQEAQAQRVCIDEERAALEFR
jgi:hypothetical protein